MQRLDEKQLSDALTRLPQWKLEDGRLVRDWTFKDFVAAIAFVNAVAPIAEAAGHHPDIEIHYNRVRLGLVTHDSNGITARDVEMAESFDQNLGLFPN
jgi:4a-hydroxytetrahydrobiopterin dehydratase